MISTKGRYAVRMLIDLAENSNGGYVSMKSVASRQGISLKYLERIVPSLTRAGLIEGVQGAGGGYRLLRDPKDLTISEVLELTETDMAPVACLSKNAEPCDRMQECPTISMWKGYQKVTDKYFGNIKLSDLCGK